MRDVAGARRIHSDIRRLLTLDPTDEEVAADLGRATPALLVFMAKTGTAAEARTILADYRRELQALAENTRENLYIGAVFVE